MEHRLPFAVVTVTKKGRLLRKTTVVGLSVFATLVASLVVVGALSKLTAICPRIVAGLVIAVAVITEPLLTTTTPVLAVLTTPPTPVLMLALGSSPVLATAELVEPVQLIVVTQISLAVLTTTPIVLALLAQKPTALLVLAYGITTGISPAIIKPAIQPPITLSPTQPTDPSQLSITGIGLTHQTAGLSSPVRKTRAIRQNHTVGKITTLLIPEFPTFGPTRPLAIQRTSSSPDTPDLDGFSRSAFKTIDGLRPGIPI